MRLLRVNDLTFEEHFEPYIPQYAILSHRWEEEEILYADIITRQYEHKKVFQLLKYMCEQARKDNLTFIWIDTFCIDKSSSADLSEAINSMCRWYENSEICYAYLSDCEAVASDPKQFIPSTWFTRGWTLQELIAPTELVFFDKCWRLIGSRSRYCEEISQRTKIPWEIFSSRGCLMNGMLLVYPVARRMSWAAHRQTTRIEDQAYSLLGLLGVSIPLLYGEGPRAFERLQEEILRASNDLSVLAWTHRRTPDDPEPRDGQLFAESPAQYADCHDMEFSTSYQQRSMEEMIVTITNLGLLVDRPRLVEISSFSGPKLLLSLGCYHHNRVMKITALKLAGVATRYSEGMRCCDPDDETVTVSRMFYVTTEICGDSGPLNLPRTIEVNLFDCREIETWPTVLIERVHTRLPRYLVPSLYPGEHTHVGIVNKCSRAWSVIDALPREHWNREEMIFRISAPARYNRHFPTDRIGSIALQDGFGNRITITFVSHFDSSRYLFEYGVSDCEENGNYSRHTMAIRGGQLHVGFVEAMRGAANIAQLIVAMKATQ